MNSRSFEMVVKGERYGVASIPLYELYFSTYLTSVIRNVA